VVAMILRSGFMYLEFPIIDFDSASHYWRLNKRKVRGIEGMVRYI